jgi:hypothetical protein
MTDTSISLLFVVIMLSGSGTRLALLAHDIIFLTLLLYYLINGSEFILLATTTAIAIHIIGLHK